MDWDELMTSVKDLPDTTEFELGGKKLTVGQLKEVSTAAQKKISDTLKDAETRRTTAVADAEKAAKILADLTEAEKAAAGKSKPPVDDTDDFDTNNWWTPVRKRMTAQEAIIKSLTEQVKASNEAIGRAASIWAEDRWRGQFDRGSDRLSKSKHKGMSYEDVREYATKNKLLDGYGFPSIDKAIAELTKEEELSAAITKAREEGIREGQTRARLASSSRPTSHSGDRSKQVKNIDPGNNLEDLGDAVADDRELAEMLAQVQGIDPETLVT